MKYFIWNSFFFLILAALNLLIGSLQYNKVTYNKVCLQILLLKMKKIKFRTNWNIIMNSFERLWWHFHMVAFIDIKSQTLINRFSQLNNITTNLSCFIIPYIMSIFKIHDDYKRFTISYFGSHKLEKFIKSHKDLLKIQNPKRSEIELKCLIF
jgi:hypothetical protein